MNIHEFFPLDTPRETQTLLLDKIQAAINDGVKVILIEAPVGSGKSPLAITLARWIGDAHILTPRKSLQNQYFDDFSEHVVLMKGRNAYPCTYETSHENYKRVIRLVQTGNLAAPLSSEDSCASGPCKGDTKVFRECADTYGPCPYHVAIEVAQGSKVIIHNLHSFIFQAHFSGRFSQRKAMIVDEAHEIEGIVRNFVTKKFTIPRLLTDEEEPGDFQTIQEWFDFFSRPEFSPADDGSDRRKKYLESLNAFENLIENFGDRFVVSRQVNKDFRYTKFEFTPESLGSMASTLIFNYGETVILMSGTIYDKNQFCRNVGLNPAEVMFLKIGSSFPKESRPIYMKSRYMVDTSHRMWRANLPEIIEKINDVCDKFPDVKGLIHAPSYDAAQELTYNLARAGNTRIVMHERDNFQVRLENFFGSSGNGVFISPICQQGVDFKDDRARFQIILRVPYPNAGDDFMAYKVKNDFAWYNYQALVTFGQQIGRVNRSETDFGVTILMDDRFPQFIQRNKRVLPKWLLSAIIT
jgi:Rad3-related DNA helicase